MSAGDAPLLSIIVPVLNEASHIDEFLTRLRDSFPAAQLLLVDGGSADDTVSQVLRCGVPVLLGEAGRARQMNLGAAASRGEWLLFLHADCCPEFSELEIQSLLNHGTRARADGWTFFNVKLRGQSGLLSVIAWFMNHRSRLTRVATGDQGLLIRRTLFERLEGFALIPLMEDVELSKRLRRVAAPLDTKLRISASGRRWDEQGALRTILRMWGLRLAYWLGVSPHRLWHHYYGRRALGEQRAALAHE
ncbi:MAG: TIGR04283 family arsenosugar biosynthesis glycosyltransferase [Pseudomonadota bacterium]